MEEVSRLDKKMGGNEVREEELVVMETLKKYSKATWQLKEEILISPENSFDLRIWMAKNWVDDTHTALMMMMMRTVIVWQRSEPTK